MATVIGTEAANGLKLGGAVAGDVGELIPFAQTIFALTNVLVECALTAKAYGNSCTRLAERISSISNTLRLCFDTNDENCTTGACDMKDTSLVECKNELESEKQSACALLNRFSGSEKGIEHAIRVLKAKKNFQGEFLTCDARLVELELRLARSFVFDLTSEQAQNRGQENRDHQVVIGELEAVLRKLETGPDEMVRALEDDGLSNTKTLENELGSCPERSAVLSMHGLEVKVTESYLKAADSGLGSKGLDQNKPWYVEAALVEKLTNVNGERIILSPLGAVGFGNVFKDMFMGLEVAIKQIKLAGIKALAELRNELGIIWRLSHESIVQTRGGFYPRTQMDMHNAECPFFVVEYAAKGSLEMHMFLDSGKELRSSEQLLTIFRSIVDGLKYLHGNNIIHRNMKPENVLLLEDLTPKISDFGLSSVESSCSRTDASVGTCGHLAPEVLGGNQYSRASDFCSYGVMLFEMLLGEKVYRSGISEIEILRIFEDPKAGVLWDRLNRSEYAKQWPAWVVNTARACLRTTPEERPTVSDIWREFYDRMGAESATAAAKSQTAQYTAFPSGPSTAEVDALAGNISEVKVLSGESATATIQPAADERADVEQEARDLPAQPEVELAAARPREEEAAAAEEARCDAADWQQRGRTVEDKEDFAEALVWYHKAVEKGDAYAQCRLGCFCIKRLGGLCQDSSAAVAWFRKAAEQGHADAQHKMGYFYEQGRDELPVDRYVAVEWYRKAAEQGHTDAQYKLGFCYENGVGGLRVGKFAAVQWYRKAAEQGHADAQCILGICYENGEGGLSQDSCEAVKWCHKAAHRRNATAQYKLGFCYENGVGGLRVGKFAAVKWCRKAAEQGNTDAQNRLKELGYQCLLKAK